MELPDACLHHLFERQARAAPDRAAVIDGGGAFTYAQLDRRANGIAHLLKGLGTGREERVAVLMGRCREHVAALLGILKCGAAYLPLDPRTPAERLRILLEESGVRAVLCGQHAGIELPAGVRAVGAGDHRAEREAGPAVRVEPANVAYVFHTSGSTGRPKAVEVEHRGVVNEVVWTGAAYGLSPADRACWLASPAFAVSRWELWPYLASGVTIHIAGDEDVAHPTRLQAWLVANRITLAFVVTALAESMWQLDWPPGTALRLMATGGEKVQRWPPRSLPFRVLVAYGITETSGVRVAHAILPGDPRGAAGPPIGLPVANTTARVLDERLRPVPTGTCGELVLGGLGLARGYPRLPGVTADRFVPDPFTSEAGARAYRTGDVVRRSADGSLEFVGRTDDQVKVHGIRVELGEVEAALREQRGVDAGVVALRDDPRGSPALVAYVVPRSSREPGLAELRAGMARSLPWHMLPRAVVRLQALPLGLNGKVDRGRLPAPAWPEPGQRGAPPTTALGCMIASAVGAVLGIPEPGLEDDFLVLGGDSLRAAQLAALLGQRLGRRVPVGWVFEHRTTAAMEARLRAAANDELADGEESGADDVQRMLDGMSDAEVQALLGGMVPDAAGDA
jgi:amino acid adenylation domain-containing protein